MTKTHALLFFASMNVSLVLLVGKLIGIMVELFLIIWVVISYINLKLFRG